MIPILIGSQTGNGLHLGRLLAKTIQPSFISAIDDFDLLKINNFNLVVFILSTHGDGQSPYTAAKLYSMVTFQAGLKSPKRLFRFNFAVLGLGDSSYQKYNYCARIFSEKLEILGAKCLVKEFSDAQEENGMYDGFQRFINCLVDLGYNKGVIISGDSTNIDTSNSTNPDAGTNTEMNTCNNLNPITNPSLIINHSLNPITNKIDNLFVAGNYRAKVLSNTMVTPKNYNSPVYEIVLEVPGYNPANFSPGDTISILPKNIINLKSHFNISTEQAEILKTSVDFLAPIHQTFFADLPRFTDSAQHKEKLLEISRDYSLYHDYVVVPRRNVIEVAEDFNLKLPFEFLRELNPIYPRYFSFSLIYDKNGNPKLHILYNIIEYSTYLEKRRLGLCSQYLSTLREADSIYIGICQGKLFFEEPKLLFFATGTGVTLPRSAIHHFGKTKEIKVFYGFRFYEKDQLCKDEMAGIDITYVASRDDKKYITDAYKDSPVENIDEWLVFISGNSRLNKTIRDLFREVYGKDVIFQSETW